MSQRLLVGEHDHEPQPGLPQPLPPGERLIWQGAPDWRVLAWRSFHLGKFALYFAVLIAWRAIASLSDGAGLAAALATTLWPVPLAALSLGFIVLLAWLVSRNSLYTLTDRRLVMRVGVVLTVTFNLPLKRIDAAQVHARADGSGDVSLLLNPEDRIGYLHLWPHVRPWRFARTEPSLRALPQVAPVGAMLAEALTRSLQSDPRAAQSLVPAPTGKLDADRQPAAGHQHLPHAA